MRRHRKRESDVLLAVKRLKERSDFRWRRWIKNVDFERFINDSMEELTAGPGGEGIPYGIPLTQTVAEYLSSRLCQCNQDRVSDEPPKKPLAPFSKDLWNNFTTAVEEEYRHPFKATASRSLGNSSGSGRGHGGGRGEGNGSQVPLQQNRTATIAMEPPFATTTSLRIVAGAAEREGKGSPDADSTGRSGTSGSLGRNSLSLEKAFKDLRPEGDTLWDEVTESATHKNSRVQILLATYATDKDKTLEDENKDHHQYKGYAKAHQHAYFVQGALYGATLFLLVPGGITCLVLGAANPKFLGGSSHAVNLFAGGAAILVVAALAALAAFHLGYKRARKSEAGWTYNTALEELRRKKAETGSGSSGSIMTSGDSGERRVGVNLGRPMAAELLDDGKGSKNSEGSEKKEETRRRRYSAGLVLSYDAHPYAKHRSYVVSGFWYGGGIAFLLVAGTTAIILANVTTKGSVLASTGGKELLYGAAALMFLGAAFLLWKAISKGSEAKEADRSCYERRGSTTQV